MSQTFFDISTQKCANDLLLERLFEAFDSYPQSQPPCDQCFGGYYDINTRVNRKTSIRKLPADSISPLYYEHPGCAGYNNFKRFFPTMLCQNLWLDSDLNFFYRACTAGLWGWPNDEQKSVQEVLLASFRNFVEAGSVEPLKCDITNNSFAVAGHGLLHCLVMVRTHPEQLLTYLMKMSGARITDTPNGMVALRARLLLCTAIMKPINIGLMDIYSSRGENSMLGPRLCALLLHELTYQIVSEEILIDWYLETDQLVSINSGLRKNLWVKYKEFAVLLSKPSV